MKKLLVVLCLVPTFFLAGCSTISGWFGSNKPDPKTFTVEQFYREARDELDAGNFAAAVKSYEALEARYPFGKYAQQAQLDVTYAHYKDGDTAEATASADRFIKLHPNHVAVDYALYIKGLALFKPDLGFLGEVLNLDASDRDQKALRESFEAFKELVTRFPDSIYTPDTRIRMVYLSIPWPSMT
jgi:outer membrane protein assembly factor BamD